MTYIKKIIRAIAGVVERTTKKDRYIALSATLCLVVCIVLLFGLNSAEASGEEKYNISSGQLVASAAGPEKEYTSVYEIGAEMDMQGDTVQETAEAVENAENAPEAAASVTAAETADNASSGTSDTVINAENGKLGQALFAAVISAQQKAENSEPDVPEKVIIVNGVDIDNEFGTVDDPEYLEIALTDEELEKLSNREQVTYLSVYTKGTSDTTVAFIQQRLMELGFMEYADPTNYYGSITMEAVKLFQRQNDLKQDGIIGTETLPMLLSEDAKSYLAKNGMDGDDIKRIQTRLYELGYLAGTSQITGHFGDETEAAVKAMQSANGLAADGKVGMMTNELMYTEEVKANILSFGEKSEIVKAAQERLKELGYLTTTPDGVFGNDTVIAVKQFQARNDLIVDGYLGPSTRTELMSEFAVANGVRLGDEGDAVKRIQELLIKLGYMSKATGYFGDTTEAAVKAFQRNNGLTADGNVGAKTMSKLTSGNAVKAGEGGNNNGGSNGGDTGKTEVTASATIDGLIKLARTKLGCKYVWGSKGPNTFDCSGFVYWCLNSVGIKQSYITSYGWRSVSKYKKITKFSDIRKGDVVVVYGHVGIASSSTTVIDASSSSGKIVERDLGSWWKNNFICAWRIFD